VPRQRATGGKFKVYFRDGLIVGLIEWKVIRAFVDRQQRVAYVPLIGVGIMDLLERGVYRRAEIGLVDIECKILPQIRKILNTGTAMSNGGNIGGRVREDGVVGRNAPVCRDSRAKNGHLFDVHEPVVIRLIIHAASNDNVVAQVPGVKKLVGIGRSPHDILPKAAFLGGNDRLRIDRKQGEGATTEVQDRASSGIMTGLIREPGELSKHVRVPASA
jgi:hypothetical protein